MGQSTPPLGELPASRLDTYLDESRQFALYFLEGQRLIHDLAVLHLPDTTGSRFAWFRDLVLGIQPLIALLKGGEQLGFYIDSERPRFRLKLETNHQGATRCALVADDGCGTPDTMTGLLRLLKLFPNNQPPYQSVLEVRDLPLQAIVNRVLQHSYQVTAKSWSRRSATRA
jgi:molecular chaperone Hsp33